MCAVIKTGGKQYRVAEGDTLQIEKLAGSAGEAIEFNDVLLVGGGDEVKVGKPVVTGAGVKAEILSQDKGDKIIVFKMRRRKNYRRKQGHRQLYTRVKIKAISC